MPGIFYQPLSRRAFLTRTAGAAITVSAVGLVEGKPASKDQPYHLALLSDTHIPADPKNEFRKFFPTENLKRVIPQVNAVQPDAILLNGDGARLTGEVADYEALKSLLNPLAERRPIYIGMGNHDDRTNFSKTFTAPPELKQKVQDKNVLVIEQPALRIILLDSLLYTNKVAGLLGKTQRDWLGGFLKLSDSKPTILFVHHTLGDGDGELLDADRLFELIHPHKKVKAIFYGHSHEYNFKKRDGVHLVNLPALGYNFADKEPVGWVDSIFTKKGVQLTLNAIGGNMEQNGQTVSLSWR